ncbi:multifunctional cyclase-dehydratase-3-O-methyl transferase TcmN [Janthinobacterium sp. HH103]|uniref:methyltransferase domain-containing protein n=1 Tax=unclassified Janthinobacterium TaxID=2610881 RepID=UPI0008751ACF|nr:MULTISPECIES: methyltransferase domain-containing protein [unclassified Janthinobacterium]OEZ55991.1 multifunctional cyclase-dehydratase-3-O-methyl transferase TcmN [Janthinobacterium sp. HH100]OEZ70658.1 multifunctional cyclase-dehydratase-3-O-methyl transferase TcmN [Janthinobacterium sp. HH103]QOU70866.1 O-methyltransferase domain protein [Janthinobacterium sp. HH102]
MSFDTQHALQPYWDLAVAPVQADGLAAALELGIFEVLATPHTPAQLADVLSLHAPHTALLLELLWSMQVLERDGADTEALRYRCTATTLQYFCRDSVAFCGDAWLYRLHALRHFATQLNTLVRDGGKVTPYSTASGVNWATAAQQQIGQEQRAVTMRAALCVMQRVAPFADGNTPLRLLDAGGGPGWVAIALAQAHAGVHGCVFDWPETVAVAAANIAHAQLSDRLETLGGDLDSDDIGGGYDLIWCSSVLHFVPDMAAALRKMQAALKPGGVLVCIQAEIAAAPGDAARVLPYYLPMRMLGRTVTRHGELAQLLRDTGWRQVEQYGASDFPMAPVQVLIARA